MEVRPRDPISDLDTLHIVNTGQTTGQAVNPHPEINPISLLKTDFDLRDDYSKLLKDHQKQQMYPLAVGSNVDNDRWRNSYGGKYFNRYYKVISSKKKTLMPGEIFMYDVVIPGFGFDFDRYVESREYEVHDKDDNLKEYRYKLKQSQSTFTRFLIMRLKGVPQYNALPSTVKTTDDNGQVVDLIVDGKTVPQWVMGEKGYPIGLKCNLTARKYLKARLVPKSSKRLKMRTEGVGDIDWSGIMSDSSIPSRQFDSFEMMTFNGKNVQAVNKYPNVLDVNVTNTVNTIQSGSTPSG